MSRLRSEADSDSYCMATCNPDSSSWVLKWITWWLDEEGFPDPDKCGKVRYYILIDDQPIFADTAEELYEKYPEHTRVFNPNTNEYIRIEPKTFSFVSGSIFDNPILIEKNPRYLAELQSLPKIERMRLLEGNWLVEPEGSNYFHRDWLHKVDKIPINCEVVRAWDLAYEEPSDKNRYPDFSASIKMAKDKDGFYYIMGDYAPDNREDDNIVGRFRKRPGERDTLLINQAIWDTPDVKVVIPLDPGAGKIVFQELSKKLVERGFIVKSDPMPNNRSKLKRFEPFSSACQNGLIHIVESSFPNKSVLEHFYKELELFSGERSSSSRKDDLVDSTASAFNFLASTKVVPTIAVPNFTQNNPFNIWEN